MIIMYPGKIEAHDEESHDVLFTVECFDEGAAKVTIDSVVNVALWDEIAPKIREALVMMQLEGGHQVNKIANVIFAAAFGALAGVALAHGLARYL